MFKTITLIIVIAAVACSASTAAVVYQEGFDSGAMLFGNERGNWFAGGGVYDAQNPNNVPPTYSALPFNLRDFAVEMDINSVSDGGVWLRSRDVSGQMSGVLLVTGGRVRTGRGFYWHIVNNDSYGGIINEATPLFTQGDDIHIRVEVTGDDYAVFLNGSETAATSISTSLFDTGAVALYDFSGQTFDNVVVEASGSQVIAGLRDTRHDIIDEASARFLYTAYGRVQSQGTGAVTINDGSGAVTTIYCSDVSALTPGKYIKATGILFKQGSVSSLGCLPTDVEVLWSPG